MITKTKTIKKSEPRQRIIDAALDLFYSQGYRATGINQVIEQADVSKASFYDHFPSKEDLCIAYLEARHNVWGGWLKDKINAAKTPLGRFMAPIDFIEQWMQDCNFRGCAFLNIASEIPEIDSNIRREVVYAKDGLKTILRELIKDLAKSDRKYAKLDVEETMEAYYVLLEGAIVGSQNYGDIGPIKTARRMIEKLI